VVNRWSLHALIQLVCNEILKQPENSVLYLRGIREALALSQKRAKDGEGNIGLTS